MSDRLQLPPGFWPSAIKVLGFQALTLMLLWWLQDSFGG